MTPTQWSIDRSHFAAALVVAIVVVGLWLFAGYPSQEDPEFTIREAVVTTRFPGMSPTRVEDLITRVVEEEIRRIPEVEHIESSSRIGESIVHVTVHDRYFDLQPIWHDLRNRMEDVRKSLPDGSQGPFVNDDFGRVAVASLAITGEGFSLSEMEDVAEDLRDLLYPIRGVSQVVLHGVQEERIFLEVNPARFAELGLNPMQVIQTLRAQNVVMPGGRLEVDGQSVFFEPSGNLQSVEELENLVIAIPGRDEVAALRDLVNVRRALVDPPTRPVFYQGRPAIVVEVSMVEGENIVEFGGRLLESVRRFESALPIGYEIHRATFQPTLVQASISDFLGNLYQTILIVLVVVVVFLGPRTGLVVGLLVPLTILAALPVMSWLDIPLHTVSVAALIIALGLLVDNGVVMAEEVRSRIRAGEDRREAAIAAGEELAMPLLSSSLTTILAFMPLMLADNAAGEYTRSLSQVIAIALLSSWFLALYVTPLFCVWFVKVGEPISDAERFGSRFYLGYAALLAALLRRRLLFLVVMVCCLIGAVQLFAWVPKQFFPESQRDQYLIYFDLAAGTEITRTERELLRFSRWLADPEQNDGVIDHVAYVGYGGPRFVLSLTPPDPASHRALVLVNTQPGIDLDAQIEKTRVHLIAHFPEVRGRVKRLAQGPSDPGTVAIRILGEDRESVYGLGGAVTDVFREVEGIVDLEDDWENLTRKIRVEIDQAEARRLGISSEEIGRTLTALFDGIPITEYREGDTIIPVVVRSHAEGRQRLDQLGSMSVYSATRGISVPLLQIARFDFEWQYGTIQRRDLTRTLTVQARHPRMTAQALSERIEPAIASLDWPAGHRFEVAGELEDSRRAQSALFSSVPYCAAAIVILLVWQFNSIRRPLVIFLTIPLALIGAVLGLLATGASFGFMATLGLLSLAGIIINNAIVLIDRIDTEIAEGREPWDAVLTASVRRLRPILMTALTTVLGLMPLLLFGGSLWFGMAVVIAFGLGLGTLLTLGVVPVLYALLFRVEEPAERPRSL